MNPLSNELVTGTVGELLVQLRLLQYGVQAAPPLKDTGNDLIAVRGGTFRAIQVKTTRLRNLRVQPPPPEREYHLLAVVGLEGEDEKLHLDDSRIYLIPRQDVNGRIPMELDQYVLSERLVETFFAECQRSPESLPE